jgi:hypothetical protein
MAVLDLQRRSQQIGRIRTGIQVQISNGGRGRPAKLDTLRFTSGSKFAVEAVSILYGGDVRPWKNGSRNEWEVITKVSEIGITVPPRDAVISQFYEMWSKGGCQRRCDSRQEQKSNGPCLCPHADNPGDPVQVELAALERAELAKTGKACKLVTRISVMIPDLPGLGVWRLDTGSFYAAGEIIDQAALMEMARAHDVGLPAMLRLEQRQSVSNGETKTYAVPVIDVLVTARAIMTGQLAAGGAAAQLPPAPGESPRAITAGTTQGAAEPAKSATPPATAPMTAQQFADAAPLAATRDEVNVLVTQATEARVLEDQVCTKVDGQETWEELVEVLRARYRELSPAREAKTAEPAAATPAASAAPAETTDGSLFGEDDWPQEAQR